MRKRYFWAFQEINEVKYLWRFRSVDDRRKWFASRQPTNYPIEYPNGSHPEVRRINRRIAAGESITFPVELD